MFFSFIIVEEYSNIYENMNCNDEVTLIKRKYK